MPKGTNGKDRKIIVSMDELYAQYEFLKSEDRLSNASLSYRAYVEALGEYMRALEIVEETRMTRDQLILDGLMLHALDMLKSDPKLLALAPKNGLTKTHFKQAEGLRRMSELVKKANAAAEKLAMDGKLTKEEQEGYLTYEEEQKFKSGQMTEEEKQELLDSRKLSEEDAQRTIEERTLTKAEKEICINTLLCQRALFQPSKMILKE